jgi:hypothetical protein
LFNAWAAVHTNESSLEQFAVYPNPSSGQVLLSWPSEFGLVEVRTSTGQLLLKQRIERGIQPLGIQLSPGIYFVLAKKNDQGSYLKTTKIVIH